LLVRRNLTEYMCFKYLLENAALLVVSQEEINWYLREMKHNERRIIGLTDMVKNYVNQHNPHNIS